MSRWYRASRISDLPQVFSGDGGLMTAARWNALGRMAVYCSESIALCTLEWLAHNGLSVSGFDYYRFSIEVSDSLIKKFMLKDLPKEWKTVPSTDMTRDFAEQHLFSEEKHLAIAVPSVFVPEEYNLIINPLHKNFTKVLKSAKILDRYIAPTRDTGSDK